MADLKTHLRELSVATTIGILKKSLNYSLEDLYIPKKFYLIAEAVIDNDISSAYDIYEQKNFAGELQQIISNGYKLGLAIFNCPEFKIANSDTITWVGNNTQKDDPTDITVGNYRFSLKEESFILENMGLYKLLNCFTGSSYTRGRHIFKDYAHEEYEDWFSVTWNEMLKILQDAHSWNFQKNNTCSEIKITTSVHFNYYKNDILEATSTIPINCNLSIFNQKTSSKTREKVFSKFINRELQYNRSYNEAKNKCALVAAEAVAKELNDNLNYSSGITRFLRFYDFEYYYAKTTLSQVEIFKIPAAKFFTDNIVVDSIKASVPESQANILTTIRNTTTNKTLTFRNECRFSHGQFNGTPEAKLYYENDMDTLDVIYTPIPLV